MKTDAALKTDVQEELAWDPAVKAGDIGVIVKDGVVTLTGHLDTFAQKYAAERAVRRVKGVKAIAMEVDVKIAAAHKRSDSEIADAVENALNWHVVVAPDQVQATVERGWVTLRGELEWDYQRRAIEKAIRPLLGVTGISNFITLRSRPVPADLHKRIEDALARQAAREARRIDVAVDGSRVTLRGRVHSHAEREAAQGVAWSSPGVMEVVNDIVVEA